MNVADVHMKEGFITAKITIKTTNGKIDEMDDLHKAQARKLYRFAQEMEETKKEERRQRDLEDKRAMAGGGIVINSPQAAPQAAPAPNPMEDAVASLGKLKTLLDNGLITQGEYDAKKVDLLARM